MNAEARLLGYSTLVDARLAELLAGLREDVPKPLVEAIRYSVLSPGKRMRPALCMASCHAVGGSKSGGLDAGCAIELVHCFSLIHDDLPAIDNDALRRGQPTVHIEFGEATAILAGDAIFALAFEWMASSVSDPSKALDAVRTMAEASGPRGLVGGEMADILAEQQTVSGDEVRRIHERKTAQLIFAACKVGAILGGGSQEQVEALSVFGKRAGLAFQISDDLLNELSTSAALGKSVGSDRQRNKATFPTAFGVERSKVLADEEVQAALDSLSEFDEKADDLRMFARYIVERLR